MPTPPNNFWRLRLEIPSTRRPCARPGKKNGMCERGNNCIYAHGENDLRQSNSMPTAYPPQYGGIPASQSISNMHANNARYKTSMCIAFAKNGFCTKLANCQYAHGPQELRMSSSGLPTPVLAMGAMNSMGNMDNMNSMNSMSNMGGMNSMGNMGVMNSMGNMGGMNNMNSMGNMGSMGMS